MTAPLTVDVTGWMIAALNASSTLHARAAAETPTDLAQQVPFVRVVRVGGPNDGVILDVPTMVFDCYATSQQAANTLAYQVIDEVRRLVGVVSGGAVITQLRTLSGPAWASTADQGLRRAVLTLQPRIKITT